MAMSIEGSKLRHDHEKAPIHSAGPLEEDGGFIHTDKKKSEGVFSRSWPSGREPYYPNQSSVFHGCLHHEYVMERWNMQAVDLSPDNTYEVTVQKHAYGGWFEGLEFIKDGKVYIIGADIQLFGENNSCATTKFIHIVKDDGYTYIVAQPMTFSEHRLRINIEDQISPETKDMGQRLGIYPVENSWNLPRSHRYHILNFPPEILHIIFKYLLWVPYAFVEPDVIITNVVKSYEKFKKPTYKATLLNEFLPMHNDDATYQPWRGSAMIKEKKICHGGREIIQLNRILRLMIDATCLRTCREFFQFGSAILYGNNIFKFPNPDREKPKLGQLYDWPQAIPYVMEQIRQGVPLKEFAGWAYHDLFLRFLYVIRPRNVDLMKHLYFWGTVSIHRCNSNFRDGRCPNCPVSLFPEMCIYIQFINELCPSVERVTLEIDAPTLSNAYDSTFSIQKERDFEHTITPFLMNQIRELNFVKSLTLRSWDTGGLKYAYDNPDRIHGSQDLDFPIAKETIRWFEDRAKGWAKEEQ
ncbi:uncharacterized protein EAE97_009942 [Botrytis byssoidea]|uniref:Uncharacterized protein n=1 Tax=Botrytis byssoidea TaxID=139641 RepID=A0A9P5I0F8_9HELO|nr:uncharacterized protein EAE97_009942 [Botrytis byssoidea]KAF7928144.1 hypothetical protein EAE97_009942 [Botrytis byssoidea]